MQKCLYFEKISIAFLLQIVHFRLQTCVLITKVAFRFTNATFRITIERRDLYDYIFYLQQGANLNLPHLKARLVESGVWEENKEFSLEDAKKLLNDRFETIDYASAKDDIRPFIKDHDSLKLWSTDFFQQITNQMLK